MIAFALHKTISLSKTYTISIIEDRLAIWQIVSHILREISAAQGEKVTRDDRSSMKGHALVTPCLGSQGQGHGTSP